MEFQILLRRNIPFLTKGVWILTIVALIILALFWVFMLPAQESKSSLEMKTAYYILAVPGWLKYISGLALLVLIILIPLHHIRRKTLALLKTDDNALMIQSKHLDISIQFLNIKRLFINDLTDANGEKKYQLQVGINYYSGNTIVFYLLKYEDYFDLMGSFSNIDPAKFSFYDKKLLVFNDEH